MSDILISRLTFQMAADVAVLKQNMADAKSAVGGAVSDIKGALDLMKAAFVAVGTAVALNEIKEMVTNVAEARSHLLDLAASAGTTVEALSGLAAVGRLTGTSADDIASSMEKMSKNMAKATEDGNGIGQALKFLGINFDEFKAMSPDEKMMALASSMDEVAVGSGKTAIAMDIFGKTGASMIPVLRDLAEQGTLQAKVTTEQALRSKDFDDSLKRINASSEAWKKELVSGVMPALDDTAGAVLRMVTQTGGLKDIIHGLVADGSIEQWTAAAINGFSYVLDAGEYVIRLFSLVGKSIYESVSISISFFDGVGTAMSKLQHGDFAGAAATLTGAFADIKDSATDVSKAVSDAFSNETFGAKMRDAIATQAVLNQAMLNNKMAADDGKKSADAYSSSVAQLTDKQNEAITAWNAAIDAVRKSIAASDAALDAGRKLTDAEKLQAETIAKLTQYRGQYTQAEWEAINADLQLAVTKERNRLAMEQDIQETQKNIDAIYSLTDTLDKQIQSERDKIAVMGMSKEQADAYRAAQLLVTAATYDQKASVMDLIDTTGQLGNVYRTIGDQYRQLSQQMTDQSVKQATLDLKKAFEDTATSIDNSLTSAFSNAFTQGKSLAAGLKSALMQMFDGLVLRPIISAIMAPVSNMASGLLQSVGLAQSGGSATSMLSNGVGLFGNTGLFGGGSLSNAGGILGAFSQGMSGSAAIGTGSSFASTVGGGLATDAMGAGVAEGAAAAGIETGVGAGVTAGLAAIPVVGWIGLAALALYSIFGGKGGAPKSEAGFADGFNISGTDILGGHPGGQRGDVAAAQSLSDGISASYKGIADELGIVNDKINVGLFYAQDPGGTSMTQLQVVSDHYNRSDTMGGIENVARGDDALKTALADETARVIFSELRANIGGTIGASLAKVNVSGFKADDLTTLLNGLQGLYKQFSDLKTVTLQLEPLGGIFGKIAGSSLDARTSLIAMAGSVDALIAKSNKFVDLYYSDSEKQAIEAKQIVSAAKGAGVDLTGINTMSDYRTLLESQDPNTQAGQKAINTLLDLAPTFADIAKVLGGDSGTTLNSLAGLAPGTPAADFIANLNAQNGGDATKTTNDLMQAWLDQSKSASDQLASLMQRLIETTTASAAALASIADSSAKAVSNSDPLIVSTL